MRRAGQDRDRFRRDPGRLRRDELDVEAGEPVLERHVAGDGETGGELTLGDDRGHVSAAGGEDAGVAAEALQPFPAFGVAVALEDDLIGRVAAARPGRCALRDVALELGMEQVVPVLRHGDAEALQHLRLIHQPVRLQHGADPETLRVLERNGLWLADAHRYRVEDVLRQVELHDQLLLRELVEKGAFAAPEDVRARAALPLDDLPVGDRRSGRQRARLDGDIPLFFGVFSEGGERRIGERFRHRGDQDKLVLDCACGLSGHRACQDQCN